MKIYLLKRRSTISEESAKVRKTSLYLAYHYGPHQPREYEFLNLYLYEKPRTQLERDHNKQTTLLAETIKAKKILVANSSQHGFISPILGKTSFIEFFKKVMETKKDSEGNQGCWDSAYKHLLAFSNGKDIIMDQVNEMFLERFKEYLLTTKARRGNKERKLAVNTALSYYTKVKAAVKEAHIKKLLRENPVTRVKGIRAAETHRQYLIFEELQVLMNTECDVPILKQAFLFSALTGLRFSDIHALRWNNIQYSEVDGWFIQFTQKKTKSAETLPISEQAVKLLEEKRIDDGNVFEGLQYSAWHNVKLREWISAAGINKKITFHCARHSFATLQLSMNTDIYTVSKLLGHKNLKTTEIYGKVINKRKIEAANKIPLLTSNK
ncbi:site-specific integrase [Chitinophaga sp. CB10]|uniref:site-specific integrase n=1 Tax=Chitinophaga sp. CB10 TaxID=1891659 RepID=UPI000A7F828E|nr:site-specific integrase [Chitinophaga sp. CB10]